MFVFVFTESCRQEPIAVFNGPDDPPNQFMDFLPSDAKVLEVNITTTFYTKQIVRSWSSEMTGTRFYLLAYSVIYT